MPRKAPELDLDFNIYVSPSCLSEPMDDETPATQLPPSADEVQEPTPITEPEHSEEVMLRNEPEVADHPTEQVDEGAAVEEPQPPAPLDALVTPTDDAVAYGCSEAGTTKPNPASEAAQAESDPAVSEEDCHNPEVADEPAEVADSATDPPSSKNAAAVESSLEPGAEPDTEIVAEPEHVEESLTEEPAPVLVDERHDAEEEVEPTHETEQPDLDNEQSSTEPHALGTTADDDAHQAEEPEQVAEEMEETTTDEPQDFPVEDTGAPEAAEATDADVDEDPSKEEHRRQPSTFVDRKTSLRTEALIQAAARAVVAKIEKRKSEGLVEQDDEFETSLLSTGSQDTYTLEGDAPSTYNGHDSPSRRQSSDSQIRHMPTQSFSSDEGGGSSSPNEPDDDVFSNGSNRSARSSLCSLDDAHDADVKTPQAKESLSRRESYASSTTTTSTTHSPRAASGFSTISGLSQYDKEPFVPTSREHRMPFRTPSEIRAMQMASPTPSVFNGSSPRSSKRHHHHHGGSSSTNFPPSISRLSSPAVSTTTQYSPKGRSTPTRLKPRKEAPLVLLHVTLLPLRWVWGEVLNGLDATTSSGSYDASEQLKGLRDLWRELQDRVGDTVLERGVLLPHPQEDYEVLEERLLEALELPVRRRARILECGHYLGPANVVADGEVEEEGEEEGGDERKRHWCGTCRDEIRFEALGPGKVFRVKVYASNGLMRAGAWEACWKEMERVDVEVEPIVDAALQDELEKLAVLQLEHEEQQRQEQQLALEPEEHSGRETTVERELRAGTPSLQTELPSERELPPADAQRAFMSSPPPLAMQLTQHATALRSASPLPRADLALVQQHPRPGSRQTEPIDTSEARRRRDEERLREIYGDVPPPPAQVLEPAQFPAPAGEQSLPHHTNNFEPYSRPNSRALAAPAPPLLTPGPSSLHHRPHFTPNEDPYQPPRLESPPPPHQYQRPQSATGRRPTPSSTALDENAGFVELLMEAFKVLLRDPKNVAIIVLCVFVVVMVRRPGLDGGGLQQQVQVAPVQQGPGAGHQFTFEVGQEEVRGEKGKREVPVVGGVYDTVKVVEESMSGRGAGLAGAEDTVVQLHPTEIASDSAADVEQSVEAEGYGATPIDDLLLGGLAMPTEVAMGVADEAAEIVEDDTQAAEIEAASAPREAPETESSEGMLTPEVADSVSSEDEALASPSEVEELDNLEEDTPALPEQEAIVEKDNDSHETTEHSDAEHASTPVVADDEADEVIEAELASNTDTAADDNEPIHCESSPDDEEDIHDTDEPTPTPLRHTTASTTSLFVPGPLVTERKTVRVFETVTETVQVSVVTKTETVSTVVTAVPQTVEETVYETETVRITVSVPVDGHGEDKKGEVKEKKEKKAGASCKGWF